MKTISKLALSCSTFLATATLVSTAQAQSLPTGGSVVAGTATIGAASGNSQTITQTSDRAVINWDSFDVASGNSLVFSQPDSGAATLNRVTGSTLSTIAGQITATGSVYLINPNGIQITGTGVVNVGRGFVASTLDITDGDFMAGTNSFSGTGGVVSTQGSISTGTGGFVGLLGGEVQAGGLIVAPAGTVMIGTTSTATLDLNGDNFLQVSLPGSATLAGNGSIAALSADAARDAVRHMVNLPPSVEASALSGTNGNVKLSGTITAQGGSVVVGAAGNVALTGASIDVSSATVTDGSTVTLRADALGTGVATVTTNSTSTIKTNASGAVDIYYNPASYTDATDYRGPIVDGSGTLTAWMLINTVDDLQAMNTNLAGTYALSKDIDASATWGWNVGPGLTGFTPIGTYDSHFTGRFDGLGHIISNLRIYRPYRSDIGLFGAAGASAVIRNIGLVADAIHGYQAVAALAGLNWGTISNAYATGTVSGKTDVGGLVGYNYGTITNAFSTGDVNLSGQYSSGGGGLVGGSNGTITNSYSSADVYGTVSSDSYGTSTLGGLVGANHGIISKSYATGAVVGTDDLGGLVGYYGGTSYSSISYSYATGNVSSGTNRGGLVGDFYSGNVSNVYWDSYSTGQGNPFGVTKYGSSSNVVGVSSDPSHTAAAHYAFKQSAYGNLSFTNDWFMVDGSTRPFLRSEYSTRIDSAHQIQLMVLDLDTSYTLNRDIDLGETGQHTSGTPSSYAGMWTTTGFLPIGDGGTPFTSSFDGLGHEITNLTINRPTQNNVGLFGAVGSYSKIEDLGLVSSDVTGHWYVGGLTGSSLGVISNTYVTGNVSGNDVVGGLVGDHQGTISKSYAASDVSSTGYAGGLVAINYNGTISNAYATGSVTGSTVGGLAGEYNFGEISNAYATNSVSGDIAGGLIGIFYNGTLNNTYAAGTVSGSTDAGGLAGRINAGSISNTYWDSYSTGIAGAFGAITGTGTNFTNIAELTSDPTQTDATNYAYSLGAWTNFTLSGGASDVDSVGGQSLTWRIYDGNTLPLLKAFMETAEVNVTGGSVAYNGSYQTADGSYTVADDVETSLILGSLSPTGGVDAGTYSVAIDGLYSTQQGYDLTLAAANSFIITPAALTVVYVADAASFDYGNTVGTLTGTVSATGLKGSDTLSSITNGIANWTTTADSTSDVGTYAVSGGGMSGDSANYTFTFTQAAGNATALTITPRAITVTADDLSRIYGDANPALTYAVGGDGLVNGDTLSGALATSADAASNVGAYAITQGTLANSNYAIAYTGADLTVTPRALSVVYAADAASRTYGDTPTGLTGSVTSFGLVNGDTLSGTATWTTSASGSSNVGSYAILGAGLSASSNYALTSSQAAGNATALTITPRAITVTADDLSRIYGDANPALTYAVGGDGLVNGDTLSGALATSADAASNVGAYAITQGTLANSNYAIAYTGADLTVTPRALSVVYAADAASRTYGDTPTGLTGSVTSFGLVNGDTLSGTATWTTSASGSSNVGSYAILGAGLSASSNYALTSSQAAGNATALTITPRAITVTADDLSRIYGDANPALTYAVGGDGLVNGDTLSGALATSADAASNVGAYAITQGTLANSNYAIAYTGADLTVTPRALSVVYAADAASRTYGDTPTGLTGSVTSFGLVNGDTLSGTATWTTSASGSSNVGSYAILGAGLSASSNYALTSSQAAGNATALTITPRAITVTADDLSRIYGDANPALTYAVGGDGLVNGDTLSGALATSADAASNVGAYAITQGTLANSNYAIAYTGADLTVTPRALSVVYAADAASRTYGDTPTGLTGSVTSFGLVNGDTLSGTATWTTSASGSSNVGSYAILGAGLSASSNYALTSSQAAGNATALTITPRAITVTADDLSRIYGDANPALTYAVGGDGLVNGDTLSGALATSADAASNVGAYAITQGTLANSNYAIAYTGADLTVTPRALSVVYAADAASRTYGDTPTGLTGSVTSFGLVNGDTLSGTATWTTSASGSSNVGSYAILGAGLSASSNYALTSSQAAGNATALTITPRAITVTADDLSRIYGDANPALTYAVGGDGLVNGDTLSGALATSADAASNVGAYAITQGTLANSNYAIAYTGADLTVTPRTLSVVYAADAASRTYGDTPTGLTGSVTSFGLVNGDTLSGTATWTTSASGSSNVGSYAILGAGLSASSNYALTSSQAAGNATALTITPRAITVTADDLSRIYGDANPALTYAVGGDGLVNGDTLSGALATSADAASNVGAYAITQGTLANSNYAIAYTGADLTVTPRTLSVVYAADAASRTYGDTPTGLTGSVTSFGLVNGDTLSGTATWTTSASGSSNVGSYAILGAGLSASSNYALTSSQAAGNATALTITPRAITVTADDLSRIYGDANPALTYAVGGDGLVNGDTLSGALATSADAASNVGAYAITQGTLANSNYAIAYTGADLTVTPRALSVVSVQKLIGADTDVVNWSERKPSRFNDLKAELNPVTIASEFSKATTDGTVSAPTYGALYAETIESSGNNLNSKCQYGEQGGASICSVPNR